MGVPRLYRPSSSSAFSPDGESRSAAPIGCVLTGKHLQVSGDVLANTFVSLRHRSNSHSNFQLSPAAVLFEFPDGTAVVGIIILEAIIVAYLRENTTNLSLPPFTLLRRTTGYN